MPEDKTKAEKAAGFDKPIDHKGGKLPDHIHPETLMAKGIAPDSKERVSINLAAMKAEFGEVKGKQKYTKIAIAGGFYDPNVEPIGSDYAPDLSLEGMSKEARDKVDAILKEN